jgi:hypothetical protein
VSEVFRAKNGKTYRKVPGRCCACAGADSGALCGELPDCQVLTARERELERLWAAAVFAVCALALLAVLVYGAAVKARRSLAGAGTALAADPAARVWPDAVCEMCGKVLDGGEGRHECIREVQ